MLDSRAHECQQAKMCWHSHWEEDMFTARWQSPSTKISASYSRWNWAAVLRCTFGCRKHHCIVFHAGSHSPVQILQMDMLLRVHQAGAHHAVKSCHRQPAKERNQTMILCVRIDFKGVSGRINCLYWKQVSMELAL